MICKLDIWKEVSQKNDSFMNQILSSGLRQVSILLLQNNGKLHIYLKNSGTKMSDQDLEWSEVKVLQNALIMYIYLKQYSKNFCYCPPLLWPIPAHLDMKGPFPKRPTTLCFYRTYRSYVAPPFSPLHLSSSIFCLFM